MSIISPTFLLNSIATSTALTTAFATETTEVNRLGNFLPAGTAAGAATAAAVPSTMPIRDTNGAATFGGLSIIVPSASLGGIGITGFGGQTGPFMNIIASITGNDGAGGTAFILRADKTSTFGGSMAVPQIIGTSSGAGVIPGIYRNASGDPHQDILAVQNHAGSANIFEVDDTGAHVTGVATVSGALSGSTASFSSQTWTQYAGNMSTAALFAGFVYPASSASLVVNVAPGSVWNGSTWIENPAGGSVTYGGGGGSPALPSANPRIDIIGFNASNVLAVVIGTEAAAPTPAALPAAFTPLAYIKVRPGAMQIAALGTTDTGTQSYIYRDIRANYVNPTGVGPSGSFAPLTATFITDADETTTDAMTGSKRLGAILAGGATISAGGLTGLPTPVGGAQLIRSGWRSGTDLDAALNNLTRNMVSQNLRTNPQKYLNKQSSTVWQLLAGLSGDPIAVDANGTWRVATATLATTISGSAGLRYIYADCTGTSSVGAFTLGNSTSRPAANSGQIPLCVICWDGAAIQDTLVDYSPLGVYTLTNDGANFEYGPYVTTQTSTTQTTLSSTLGTPTTMGGLATTQLYFPRKVQLVLSGAIRFANNTTPSAITTMYAAITRSGSGVTGGYLPTVTLTATGVADFSATVPDETIAAEAAYNGTAPPIYTIQGVLNTGVVTGAAIPNMIAASYTVKVY